MLTQVGNGAKSVLGGPSYKRAWGTLRRGKTGKRFPINLKKANNLEKTQVEN